MILRAVLRSGGTLAAAVAVPHEVTSEEKWKRVRHIFTIDEFGAVSREMTAITQTVMLSGFTGLCLGAFIYSRDAYLKFIERNQATQFIDHYDAKKKLQDAVILSSFKGALRWAAKLSIFTGLFVTSVTVCATYRGEASVLDYTLAGVVGGSIYKSTLGLRGAIAGGTIGGILGLFAGCMTSFLLRLSGNSFNDVLAWQVDLTNFRDRRIAQNIQSAQLSENKQYGLLVEHDKKLEEEKKLQTQL